MGEAALRCGITIRHCTNQAGGRRMMLAARAARWWECAVSELGSTPFTQQLHIGCASDAVRRPSRWHPVLPRHTTYPPPPLPRPSTFLTAHTTSSAVRFSRCLSSTSSTSPPSTLARNFCLSSRSPSPNSQTCPDDHDDDDHHRAAAKMVHSAVLGFPRMGVNRDLKKATEACKLFSASQRL